MRGCIVWMYCLRCHGETQHAFDDGWRCLVCGKRVPGKRAKRTYAAFKRSNNDEQSE